MQKKEKLRRDYKDGSLSDRASDGRWVGSFRVDGKHKTVYGKTRTEAKKKLEEAKRKAGQGMLVASSKQTLHDFLDYWLETIAPSIEPSTVGNYRGHMKRTHTALGHMPIQRITRHHIQQFVNALNEELAPSTVHTIFTILDMALDAAVKWKLLEANPCAHVILPKLVIPEQEVLTPEQAKHLVTFVADQELEPFVYLALGAGMRRGEICALRWSDVDFEKNLIHVERKVYPIRGEDGHYHMTPGPLKSKASRRVIPLASFVKEALLRHRKRQRMERMQAAIWEDNDLVFCKRSGRNAGQYRDFSTLRLRFKQLLQAAGLPDIRIHDLRHSCNTLLRMMGVDPVTRQRILGHAQPDMTDGVYGHTYDSMKQAAMEKLDVLFYTGQEREFS
jgi:integrase